MITDEPIRVYAGYYTDPVLDALLQINTIFEATNYLDMESDLTSVLNPPRDREPQTSADDLIEMYRRHVDGWCRSYGVVLASDTCIIVRSYVVKAIHVAKLEPITLADGYDEEESSIHNLCAMVEQVNDLMKYEAEDYFEDVKLEFIQIFEKDIAEPTQVIDNHQETIAIRDKLRKWYVDKTTTPLYNFVSKQQQFPIEKDNVLAEVSNYWEVASIDYLAHDMVGLTILCDVQDVDWEMIIEEATMYQPEQTNEIIRIMRMKIKLLGVPDETV